MVKLRYLKVLQDATGKDCLLQMTNPDESLRLKRRALQALGIEMKEGESPLIAWSIAMALENGFEPRIAAVEEISKAVEKDPDAVNWVMYLADGSRLDNL